MTLSSNSPTVERAQPWLGTLVSIRVSGLPESESHRAINDAFEEVGRVHRLMSFHDSASDLTRLHQGCVGKPIKVDPYTYEVLQQALAISDASDGVFDVSTAAQLMEWELLPLRRTLEAVRGGSWRDIELLPDACVVLHHPICIDLGGIAKGFAVDRAIECLKAFGALHAVVNAGGDMRVEGTMLEAICLGLSLAEEKVPIIELTDRSIASSSGHLQSRWHQGQLVGPHVDGVFRTSIRTDRFVSVVHRRCIIADALTKVVLAMGADSESVLRRYGASAYLHDPETGWHSLAEHGALAE